LVDGDIDYNMNVMKWLYCL